MLDLHGGVYRVLIICVTVSDIIICVLLFTVLLPQSPGLPIVSLFVVAGTDVPVVLISYAGLTQVLGVVASGVMLGILHTWHTAVAKEVSDRWFK